MTHTDDASPPQPTAPTPITYALVTPKKPDGNQNGADAIYRSRRFFAQSFHSGCFNMRTLVGVTSTSSSSWMYSTAMSRLSSRGGMTLTLSSLTKTGEGTRTDGENEQATAGKVLGVCVPARGAHVGERLGLANVHREVTGALAVTVRPQKGQNATR